MEKYTLGDDTVTVQARDGQVRLEVPAGSVDITPEQAEDLAMMIEAAKHDALGLGDD